MYSQRSKKAFIGLLMLVVLFGTMGNLCENGLPTREDVDRFSGCEYKNSVNGGQIPICREK